MLKLMIMIDKTFREKYFYRLKNDESSNSLSVDCYGCKKKIDVNIYDIEKTKHDKSLMKLFLCDTCSITYNNTAPDIHFVEYLSNVINKNR